MTLQMRELKKAQKKIEEPLRYHSRNFGETTRGISAQQLRYHSKLLEATRGISAQQLRYHSRNYSKLLAKFRRNNCATTRNCSRNFGAKIASRYKKCVVFPS